MTTKLKPKLVARATPEEIEGLGKTSLGWEFPPEIFDGQWWRLEIENEKAQDQALTAYRRQAQTEHKRRAQAYRKQVGNKFYVFVRRTDLQYGEGGNKRIKMKEANGADES